MRTTLAARYWFMEGRLTVDDGFDAKQDGEIEKGIRVIRKARQLAKKYPNRFVRDASYDFEIA